MTGNKRLAQAAKEFNVGIETISEHLRKKGFEVDNKPTTKLTDEMYDVLLKDFRAEKNLKERAEQINLRPTHQKPATEADKKTDNEFVAIEADHVAKNNLSEQRNQLTQPIENKEAIVSLPIVEVEKTVVQPVVVETPAIVVTEKATKEAVTLVEKPNNNAKNVVADDLHPKTTADKNKAKKTITDKTKEKPVLPVKELVVLDDIVEELDSMPLDFKPYQKQRDKNAKDELKGKQDNRPEKQGDKRAEKPIKPVLETKTEVKPEPEKQEKLSVEDMPLYRRESNPEAYGVTGPKVIGKIDLDSINLRTRPDKVKKKVKPADKSKLVATDNAPKTNGDTAENEAKKKKRKRIKVDKRPAGDSSTPTTETVVKSPTPVPTLRNRDNQNKDNNQNRDNNRGQVSNRDNTPAKDKKPKDGPKPTLTLASQMPRRTEKPQLKLRKKNEKGGPQQSGEVSEKEIQDKIRATMAKLSGGAKPKNTRAKLRKQKREIHAERLEDVSDETKTLQVTEFVSVNELAKLMDLPVTKLISTCFSLGIIVTINQRLDAELIEVMASEFGFEVEFIGATEQEEEFAEVVDDPADLEDRPPIVTIMGHVDHGKTSLLDYIRKTKVVEGEAGGITQHIGAYQVATQSGKKITFLDTPGHEAFTAMRARGAKVTDIVVIVIAADDHVMPTTKEAISHAKAAGVPMIFAINKIDRPESDPERIRQELAQMDLLVEEWGGKYQSQEISAKKGINIDELLEKILLESELLELKANPKRPAVGTVVEATLDKGKGYVTTVLVQTGTLKVGDVILCGQYWGKVRAMFNEISKKIIKVGPSGPVQILGLSGAPQAGEKIRVMNDEQEAKQIATKREQILREQQQRTRKHITLEEIGRRLALGNFKELNIIIKGDVDGSVQALSDSLLQLSTEEIQVRIIHRGVGAITETDVMLASASDAIIIGFQVRPMPNARKTAEAENIDIRTYSVIYSAIEEIKAAMEGMLEPKFEEKFACTIDIKDVFKITKVGAVAGCYVTEGKVKNDTKIRVLRDGIIVHTGVLSSLKRYKDDVKEVPAGLECGLTIKNYSDMQAGDTIEGYEEIAIKRTL